MFKILRSTLVQSILVVTLVFSGFWLLIATTYNWIGFGTSDFATWNRRLMIFLSIGMIALATAISYPTSRSKNPALKLWVFILTFILLSTILFAIGGFYGFFSAVDKDQRGVNPNDFWIGFDAGDLGLGINVWLIADAIAYILPIGVLGIAVLQLYYAGEADEYLKALLEGGVALGFMLVYAMWIVPAFR